MLVPLSSLKVNMSCIVKNVDCDIKLKRRVFELGILPEERVKVLSVSPLKSSFLIAVKNYSLALRNQILDSIMVEVL